jgi:Photosynthetic reaction centre cytochrome C subunit
MKFNQKFIVLITMAAIVTMAVAFTTPPDDEHKNLKVLPKNISHEALDKIMDGFKADLGVKCNFCHAVSKDNKDHLDFASDEKAEKGIARYMMKMSMKINKKFFEVKKPMIGDTTLIVTCNTCHHGEAHPEQPKQAKEEKH